jgi:hypothetical protein
MARSRLPLRASSSVDYERQRASSHVSQCPNRMPSFFGPFTRQIPAASSGLSSPESAASYARRRTAVRRPLIVPGARRRDSRWIR